MKKITVNGQMYLGSFKEKEGKVCLSDAMPVDRVNKASIAEYLKRKNLKELGNPTFSGMGTSVAEEDLTDEEELIFDICERAMKYAEKKAQGGMVNDMFDTALGKL